MNLQTKVFLNILPICLTIFFISNLMGNIQNEKILDENSQFHLAEESYKSNPELSISLLNELEKKRPNNYMIYLLLAISYAELGDQDAAREHYNLAMNQRPAIIFSPTIMFYMAKNAMYLKDFESADAYLLQTKQGVMNQSQRETRFKLWSLLKDMEKE